MGWAATHTFSVGEILSAANLNLIQNNINASNPVGKLSYVAAPTGGSAVETVWQTGWLECNGAVVSRSTYVSLFNYLFALSPSLPFGSGNGTTTFAVPDMRGRQPIHHGANAAISTLGANDAVADANRRPQHRTTSSLGITDPNHSHVTNSGTIYSSGGGAASSQGGVWGTIPGTTTATSATGISISGSIGTNVGTDPFDTSPYLVAGIWVVKF